MQKVGVVVRDKRVLRIIGRFLRAGVVMPEGVVVTGEEGTPQGGPLSPLLANLYLDALDKELEKRGLRFARYADDCNIHVKSQAAAERVLESLTGWIARHLRLEVSDVRWCGSPDGRNPVRATRSFGFGSAGSECQATPACERSSTFQSRVAVMTVHYLSTSVIAALRKSKPILLRRRPRGAFRSSVGGEMCEGVENGLGV